MSQKKPTHSTKTLTLKAIGEIFSHVYSCLQMSTHTHHAWRERRQQLAKLSNIKYI